MSKEMKALLKKINDMKNAIRGMQGQGKTAEMQDKMKELNDLQQEFNMLADLEDDAEEGVKNSVNAGKAKEAGQEEKPTKAKVVAAFIGMVKSAITGKRPKEEDVEIYDTMTTSKEKDQDDEQGIGVTVPDDLRTDIEELRRSSDNLEQYVNVETVRTNKGTRNIEANADTTPFPEVAEGGEYQEQDDPKFTPVNYVIKKYGGILKATLELFEDTAENVWRYIAKWIAKKSRATRNARILAVLASMTANKEVTVSNLDGLKAIFNVTLDPAVAAGAVVLTNQSGFNYLDKLKDLDGKYILQPDPTKATQKLLFGVYPVIKISNKTLASTEIKDGNTVTGYKHPLYCGDLKEAVTLFDRRLYSVDVNDRAGEFWKRDLKGVKARDRFDVQPVDTEAVVKGEVTETVSG